MKNREVRLYRSFADDFEKSAQQYFSLPKNYKWIKTDLISRILSALIYTLAIFFSYPYCYCFLHMRVKGRKNLRGINGGFFIYGNHTQPIGDVFIPALCVLPKRIYTVVSPANYGIPIIGKILPYLGALPVSDTLHGIKQLNTAIKYRLDKGNPIVIYPEAHVWEYYTEIRPFADTSFKFPAKFDKPAFAMTATYKKSKVFRRPILTVYLDGPFYPKGESAKDKAKTLCQEIYSVMKQRSEQSDCCYIEYKKIQNDF